MKKSINLPYNRQCLEDDDIQAVIEVLKSPYITTGPQAEAFAKEIAEFVGAKYAVVCSSGTAALHIAMMALDIGKGDKILTTPITFIADANAARFVGADVVFADINKQTANLDPHTVRQALNKDKQIKVVIPVHFGGQPVDMTSFDEIAKEFNVTIVEDGCHALGAEYKANNNEWVKVGRSSHSVMTVFSFHPIKSITTGEGGCITTNDKNLYERLMRLRSHGTVKSVDAIKNHDMAFTKHEGKEIYNPWYYEMQELSYNYRLSDFQCALGRSQLRKINKFISRRQQLASLYMKALQNVKEGWVEPLEVNEDIKHAYHLFVVRIPFDKIDGGRASLMNYLEERGVSTQVNYMPIYHHPYYQQTLQKQNLLPIAEEYYKACLSLPLFPCMNDEDPNIVVDILFDGIDKLKK